MTITYNSTWTATTSAYSTMYPGGSTSSGYVPSTKTSVYETTQTIFVYAGTRVAKPIILHYIQDESSESLPTTSTNSDSPLTPTSSNSVSYRPPTIDTPSATQQKGLSSGAKAGIGVGVVLGVCALLLLGFLLYRLRKRRTTRGGSTPRPRTPELSNEPMEVKELSNDTMRASELPSSPRPEM